MSSVQCRHTEEESKEKISEESCAFNSYVDLFIFFFFLSLSFGESISLRAGYLESILCLPELFRFPTSNLTHILEGNYVSIVTLKASIYKNIHAKKRNKNMYVRRDERHIEFFPCAQYSICENHKRAIGKTWKKNNITYWLMMTKDSKNFIVTTNYYSEVVLKLKRTLCQWYIIKFLKRRRRRKINDRLPFCHCISKYLRIISLWR